MKIYNIPGLNVEFPGLPVDQVWMQTYTL